MLPGMSWCIFCALPDKRRRPDQLGVQCPAETEKNILLLLPLLSDDAETGRRKDRGMTGKTHSATGFFAGLVISSYTGCSGAMTLAMVTGSVLGGLLPDIDNVHSQIGSRLPVVELIVHGCQRGIRLLSGILPRKMRENVRSMIGHRGLLIGMIAGDLSHLILDMLSGGVPLLMPFSVVRTRVCSFRTGGIVDRLWRFVMYFGICYLGLTELYQIASGYIRI